MWRKMLLMVKSCHSSYNRHFPSYSMYARGAVKGKYGFSIFKWVSDPVSLTGWPRSYLQICTVILRIRIGKVAWFAVYVCNNFWVPKYEFSIFIWVSAPVSISSRGGGINSNNLFFNKLSEQPKLGTKTLFLRCHRIISIQYELHM